MKPTFFFDYIFYRVAKVYMKWDGSNAVTAQISVSLIQTLILVAPLLLITRLLYERSVTSQYSKEIAYAAVAILFLFMLLNYQKYRHKYEELNEYWKNEEQKIKQVRGVMVLLVHVLPLAMLILMGIFW